MKVMRFVPRPVEPIRLDPRLALGAPVAPVASREEFAPLESLPVVAPREALGARAGNESRPQIGDENDSTFAGIPAVDPPCARRCRRRSDTPRAQENAHDKHGAQDPPALP
jgi:hypothetical protein